VNGGDTVFYRIVLLSLCLSVCVRTLSEPVNQTAGASRTVKDTDFKFDIRISMVSLVMIP